VSRGEGPRLHSEGERTGKGNEMQATAWIGQWQSGHTLLD